MPPRSPAWSSTCIRSLTPLMSVGADIISVPRKKRKLYTSCETCKLRRVRCEREREDLPCYKCIDKGIRCVTPGPRPRKSRTGKRIEHARALFGNDESSSSSTPPDSSEVNPHADSANPSDETMPDLPDDHPWGPEMWDEQQLVLSDESAESNLSISETIGQLSSHLIEIYFTMLLYPLPLQKWTEFRAEFDQAGRRPDQMSSPMSEVLAVTLIAYGARVSNAPIIVGRRAPALPDLDQVESELIHWGRVRANLCHHLRERAIHLADERGIFREETQESVAVLVLLDMLISHGDVTRRKGRPYRTAIAGHLRTMKEEGDATVGPCELFGGGLGWLVYIRDSIQAGISGRKPILREDDIESLCDRRTLLPFPTLADFACALSGEVHIWDPIKRVWDHISTMLRTIVTRTLPDNWRPAAEYENSVEEYIWDVYTHIDETAKCIDMLETFIDKLTALEHPGATFFKLYVGQMPMGCLVILWRVHQAINKQLQLLSTEASHATLSALDSFDPINPLDQEQRKAGLLALSAESNRRMGIAARETARRLWKAQMYIPSRAGLGILAGIHMMYETIPTWAEFLCNLPILEDGAPVDYTLDTKTEEVGWLLGACCSLGWAYEDMADTIALLERHHSALKERQAQSRTLASALQTWIPPYGVEPNAMFINPLPAPLEGPTFSYETGDPLNVFYPLPPLE